MKIVLFSVLFSILGVTQASAQKMTESEVPASVKQTMKKKYPTAKVIKWEKHGDHFKAGMSSNNKKKFVLLDNTGKLLETESEIKVSELPKTVTDFIVANFRGKNPNEAYKVTEADGKINYAVLIDHSDYIFDEHGSFLKQEMREDEPTETH